MNDSSGRKIIHVNAGTSSYDIILERGCLSAAGKLLRPERKVLIVTDSGVPRIYPETITSLSKEAFIETIEPGEDSKSVANFEKILKRMLKEGFTRSDCVAAVGGGVPGDLAGFAASAYMRGVDFYNIPTTLLSQVDSSIGGKTAVNLEGIKNVAGAFYQPKRVLIDPDVLSTLPARHINAGLAEALKMSVTCDAELFDIFENDDPYQNIDIIIEKAINVKKGVVEQDEKEAGLRKVLNFGHTLGHAIESVSAAESTDLLLHGECVSLGMIPMCSKALRPRLTAILKKLSLPTECSFDPELICEAMKHDKKSSGNMITTVVSDEPGSFRFENISASDLAARFTETFLRQ